MNIILRNSDKVSLETAQKYIQILEDTFKNRDFTREDLTDEQVEKIAKKVDNRIKAQYRFQGYQEFSNKLVRLKDKLKARKGAYEKRIKEFFHLM